MACDIFKKYVLIYLIHRMLSLDIAHKNKQYSCPNTFIVFLLYNKVNINNHYFQSKYMSKNEDIFNGLLCEDNITLTVTLVWSIWHIVYNAYIILYYIMYIYVN